MDRPYSDRSRSMQPFLAMEVMERAFELERQGARIIHLEIGEPDFAAPPAAVAACREAVSGGETHYTDSRGLAELREAIAADKARRAGVALDPERVIVTSGTSPAMLLVFGLLVEAGGEVVIPTPHYPCYPNFVRFCGGEPVFVPLADGWQVDLDAVRAALTPRTRAVVVASPANPTGAIQDAETLRALAGLGVPLVSDEIYDGIVYDGARVTSALAVSDDAFVLDGFSKRYAMTGFRLGFAVAPERALRPLQVMQQNLFISANHFVQRAGVAALAEGEATRLAMLDAYTRRRTLMVEGLRKLGFGVPSPPQGAFYVFADARAFGRDSLRLAFDLLERARVAVTPGVDFGAAGEGWLRFSLSAPDAQIREALERLGEALGSAPGP
ncbi:MAG: pyridoxal phosphate-dependent aminotransferase [Myxococcota bacterium]|nr:pyridoxal phosphate-dependent aminotransferase [Myxococcota bacterium]